MAELTSETSFLVPILILLGSALVFAPLFRFLGLGSVIGYLVAGMVIGPSGLGLIADSAHHAEHFPARRRAAAVPDRTVAQAGAAFRHAARHRARSA